MGNPWIFSEIRAALEGKEYTPPPAAERFEVALTQVQEMIAEKGERVGIAEAKKHLAWYCHGMEGAAAARGRLMQSTTYEEMADILAGMAAVADSAAAEPVADTEASHG
jgi:tRNA-dihydrouridine synthase